jgi:hypothetical protein
LCTYNDRATKTFNPRLTTPTTILKHPPVHRTGSQIHRSYPAAAPHTVYAHNLKSY